MRPRARGSTAINAVIVLIAVGTAVANSQIGTERGQAAPSEEETGASSTATQQTEATTSTTTPSPSITSEDVQSLLNRYQAAYSSESMTQFEALLAPSLTRQDDNHAPEDRKDDEEQQGTRGSDREPD